MLVLGLWWFFNYWKSIVHVEHGNIVIVCVVSVSLFLSSLLGVSELADEKKNNKTNNECGASQ